LREWGNPYGENSSQLSVVSGQLRCGACTSRDGAQFLRPQAIEAAQKLLGATGIHPVLLSVGRSSGYLPYALGLWDIARDLAQQTLAEIDRPACVK
jgi:hypothetical protein